MGVSEWWLEIGYWGIVVGDWAPQLRDALTRGLVIGPRVTAFAGHAFAWLRDALTRGLGVGPRSCGKWTRGVKLGDGLGSRTGLNAIFYPLLA